MLMSIGLYAQQNDCNITLSGYVTDEHDDTPLEFASIVIKELDKGTSTNDKGFFEFKNLCAGNYTIEYSHVSCSPGSKQIQLKENAQINLVLEHHSDIIGDVVLVDEKKENRPILSQTEIANQELDNIKGKTLGQGLKGVTGVNSLQTGTNVSKPVIHGLHSNRVLLLNNGVRHESQQWGSDHGPEIDPFVATKITVIKGANSVMYGSDAIGGVVLIEPEELPISQGVSGEVNLLGYSNGGQYISSAIVQGGVKSIDGLGWRLQGTYKRGGNAKTPNYYLDNTGYEEQNFSSAIGYQRNGYNLEVFFSRFSSDIGIFSGSHIGNLTDLQAAFENGEPFVKSGFSYEIDRPYQDITHDLLKVKGGLPTGTVGRLELVYARQNNRRLEFDSHRSTNQNSPELDFEITTQTIDLVWKHLRKNNFEGTIGMSGMNQKNLFRGRDFIPNFERNVVGAYIIERYIKTRWELEAGLRYDYNHLQVYRRGESGEVLSPDFTFQNVSATLGGLYKVNERFNWKLNMGTAWRAPGVNELFANGVHHGAATFEIGSDELSLERVYDLNTTLTYNDKKWKWGLNVYQNWINDFIYLQPVQPPTLTIRGAFPTFEYQQANVSLTGADVDAKYTYNAHWALKMVASYLYAYNLTRDDYLIQMPANRVKAKLIYSFHESEKIIHPTVSIEAEQVFRQNNVPEGEDFVAPPDAYFLLNLEGGLTTSIGKQKVDFSLTIDNLLNTRYRDYMNRLRYYADETGINVGLRLKVSF